MSTECMVTLEKYTQISISINNNNNNIPCSITKIKSFTGEKISICRSRARSTIQFNLLRRGPYKNKNSTPLNP